MCIRDRIGMALVVLLADAFAFRSAARAEALVPGTVLFVFIAALASDRLRWESAVALVASGWLTVGALRAMHERGRAVELRGSDRSVGLAGPAMLGSAVVVAAVAGLIGPRLPGADASPLFETRGRSGITTIVSPLVDMRSRLTSRGDEELFRVDADAPSYWRVSTLAAFDGQRFTLPGRPLDRVEATFATSGATPLNRQQVQVVRLGGLLVPAAADPVGAEGERNGSRLDLRVDRDSSALLAPDDLRVGDVFRIVSTRPTPDPGSLRSATSSAAPDAVFVELPPDLPPVVSALAAEVTSGATTPYERAIALQSWFRDPAEFSYSLDVQAGHGSTAIELFLDRRVGYCEQFAATFATMARTLGVPSRVAVGFTSGVLGDDGWYRVLGRNAHAWPELWFDGFGWLPFEPTPGRGLPGAEAYTGVPAAQDDGGRPDATSSTVTSTVTSPVNSPVTSPAEAGGEAPGPSTTVAGAVDPSVSTSPPSAATGRAEGDGPAPSAGESPTWNTRLAMTAIGVGALLTALFAVRSVAQQRLRRRPADRRIRSAWARACLAATDVGVEPRPSMTPQEWAAATAQQLPIAARPMASLASVIDVLAYAPAGSIDPDRIGAYGVPLVRECEQWADQIERLAGDRTTAAGRLGRIVRRTLGPG